MRNWSVRPTSTLLVLVLLGFAGCASSAGGSMNVEYARPTDAVSFAYPTIDGAAYLRDATLRGRPAFVIFITTYDLPSQAQARFLTGIYRSHAGRVGAGAVVLEPPSNRLLVFAFRDTLKIPYPMAFGDPETIAGRSVFGAVTVPMTILLDADGRIRWRKSGIVRDAELEQALADIQPRAH